jgi:hypothetical protein
MIILKDNFSLIIPMMIYNIYDDPIITLFKLSKISKFNLMNDNIKKIYYPSIP